MWAAFFAGEIVSPVSVAEMIRPRSLATENETENERRYGLGFWLHASTDVVFLEGYDAGVSFRSLHDPRVDLTATVISNWTDGAWPIAKRLAEQLRL